MNSIWTIRLFLTKPPLANAMTQDPVSNSAPPLSVVIPVRGLEPGLAATVAALAPGRASGLVAEIVLAAAESPDDLSALARKEYLSLVDCKPGRGEQLAAGAAAASGSWLLFLHADTQLEDGWERALSAFIADPENTQTAAFFRLAFDDASLGARFLSALANWRARTFALPYGDQGLAISTDLYLSLGGYRSLPLMEDVDLIRRIGRKRLCALPSRAVTSARRYRRDGWLRRPLRNAFILSLYFLGVSPQRLARLYG
jgi:rSAM/selenodomain-associated transferase 2